MDTLFNVKSQVRRKVIRIYFCDGLVWKGYSPIMRIVSEANTRNGLEYQPNMRGDLIDEYEELLLIHGGGVSANKFAVHLPCGTWSWIQVGG